MSQTTKIFGYKVKYDETSESVKHAFKFFDEIGEDATKAFFKEAYHDSTNHTCHFRVKDHSGSQEYHLSLVSESDGTFHLRKTTGY